MALIGFLLSCYKPQFINYIFFSFSHKMTSRPLTPHLPEFSPFSPAQMAKENMRWEGLAVMFNGTCAANTYSHALYLLLF